MDFSHKTLDFNYKTIILSSCYSFNFIISGASHYPYLLFKSRPPQPTTFMLSISYSTYELRTRQESIGERFENSAFGPLSETRNLMYSLPGTIVQVQVVATGTWHNTGTCSTCWDCRALASLYSTLSIYMYCTGVSYSISLSPAAIERERVVE